jgi:hypothetical protein
VVKAYADQSIFVYFFCSIFPLLSGALQMAHHASRRMLSNDPTISELRSKSSSPQDAGLNALRGVKPAPSAGSVDHDS